MIEIRKAARPKAKLRIGLSGPSGSGKTYSALLIAKGLTGDMNKVAIIDTENGSADLYSDIGPYNVITLEAPYSPEKYIEAIDACEKANMEVVIIDSASHEWDGKGGLLEANELLAQTKFKGNSWAAWSVTTPRHQKFIQSIVTSKMDMITTARSKTDTIQTEDKKIKKVGLKEIQREGFEYELTLNFTIDREGHYAIASKDRTGIFSEVDPFIITEETGKKLKAWSESGADISQKQVINQEQIDIDNAIKQKNINAGKKGQIVSLLRSIASVSNTALQTADEYNATVKSLTELDLVENNYDEIIGRLRIRFDELVEAGKLTRDGKVIAQPKVEAQPAVSAQTNG